MKQTGSMALSTSPELVMMKLPVLEVISSHDDGADGRGEVKDVRDEVFCLFHVS